MAWSAVIYLDAALCVAERGAMMEAPTEVSLGCTEA